jgi:L-iditol 2-dehydrogenase
MLRANLIKPLEIVIEQVEEPKPGKGQVQVYVRTCGICGSDVHAYHGKHPFITLPIPIGHEFSGVVSAIGDGVVNVTLGQRVTVEPSLTCGQCYNCRHGRYNICDRLRVVGCNAPGAMADYVVVPAERVIPIPDALTFSQAATVEPAAVGLHAVRRGRVGSQERLLVLGAGTIGLLTAQAAKVEEGAEVLIADYVASRLTLARQLGVDYICDLSQESLDAAVSKVFGADRADVIIECVGVEDAILSAIKVARKGSRIVVAGVHPGTAATPMGLVQDRELELIGTITYLRNDFERTIELIEQGKIKVEPLITHVFPLRQVAKAFQLIDQDKTKAVKVHIEVSR